MSEKWKLWWKAAGVRAVKTVARTGTATIVSYARLRDVTWVPVLSTDVRAGVLALLAAVAGLPEVKQEVPGDNE